MELKKHPKFNRNLLPKYFIKYSYLKNIEKRNLICKVYIQQIQLIK